MARPKPKVVISNITKASNISNTTNTLDSSTILNQKFNKWFNNFNRELLLNIVFNYNINNNNNDNIDLLDLEPSKYIEPSSYKQAIAAPDSEEWRKAMTREFNELVSKNTWKLVPRPNNKPIIKGRWVYKLKFLPNGKIDKYKAR